MIQTAEEVAYPARITETDICIKPAAEAKLVELLDEVDPELQYLRIFVTGGGCGGMTYGMTFSEGITDYDSVLAGEGYRVAVDAVALNYLRGCEIDFTGDSFIFNNVFQSVGGSGMCGGCAGGRGF